MMTRRSWIASALSIIGTIVGGGFADAHSTNFKVASFEKELAALEKASGGRLGVAVLDMVSGVQAGHRANERFPMCSTFKVLAVGVVLSRCDQGKENLQRIVHYTQKDIVTYSPATQPNIGKGMSIEELCIAAITLSDNTAANLLLASIGGPAAVTAFARSLGDTITRLDRIETELNEALPGDPRDTSTPAAMLSNLRKLTLGHRLSSRSRMLLTKWLIECKTGDQSLRAGFPASWRVGDKTGSGERGTSNDLAIVWPSRSAPLLVAVYLTGSTENSDQRHSTIAAVGKQIASMVALPV